MVRDAIVRGGGDTWSVPEFLANYSDNNIRKPFYKRIEAPRDGFLKIIPTTGAHFFNCFYFGGVEYAANYRFETGNRLDSYEDKVSIALNRILRHNVGKPQNHKACFVTMLAGYPLRTYSSVSQSGDMNTNVGRMSSSPQRESKRSKCMERERGEQPHGVAVQDHVPLCPIWTSCT